jgi:hypothetical protein
MLIPPVCLGYPANLSGACPGVEPLRLVGHPQLLAGAFGGAPKHARYQHWKGLNLLRVFMTFEVDIKDKKTRKFGFVCKSFRYLNL